MLMGGFLFVQRNWGVLSYFEHRCSDCPSTRPHQLVFLWAMPPRWLATFPGQFGNVAAPFRHRTAVALSLSFFRIIVVERLPISF